MEQLVETVGQLSEIYELPVQEKAEEAMPMFLSQLSLDEYHQKEERFSQELSHFTKKKFFEVKFSFFQNISIKLKKKMINIIKLMVINIACSNYY